MDSALYLVFLCAFANCVYSATVGNNIFGARLAKGKVNSVEVNDVSGMAASRMHENIVYVHNYQYDTNIVYALDINTGNQVAKLTIQGATNFDWEDIAYGPCVDDCRTSPCSASSPPVRYCIYIADIGNHNGDGPADVIYMVREPETLQTGEVPVVDTLSFIWPEEDAESLVVTPDARLFVISKVLTGRAMIAQIPDAAWGQILTLDLDNTGILKVFTPHHDPQGADISPDGKELIIVAEEEVFYYNVPDGNFINATRTTIPESISSYTVIPDTEAIAWSPDGQGFYTLARGVGQFIYYYPRIDDSTVIG